MSTTSNGNEISSTQAILTQTKTEIVTDAHGSESVIVKPVTTSTHVVTTSQHTPTSLDNVVVDLGSSSASSNILTIIGFALAGVCALLAIVLLIALIMAKKNSSSKQQNNDEIGYESK